MKFFILLNKVKIKNSLQTNEFIGGNDDEQGAGFIFNSKLMSESKTNRNSHPYSSINMDNIFGSKEKNSQDFAKAFQASDKVEAKWRKVINKF